MAVGGVIFNAADLEQIDVLASRYGSPPHTWLHADPFDAAFDIACALCGVRAEERAAKLRERKNGKGGKVVESAPTPEDIALLKQHKHAQRVRDATSR